MRCAIVIPTFGHSEMVVACINSYLDSGKFDGDVYVVSQDPGCHVLTNLGENVKFVDTGTVEMDSPDMSFYKGFLAFDKEYDIMICAHSDSNVNYGLNGPGSGEDWWAKMQESWNIVNKDRVCSIIIPMFAGEAGEKRGEDLICPVSPEHQFGLGSDLHNYPIQRAKSSPAHSYLVSFYTEAIAKYGGDTGIARLHLIHYEGIKKHMWTLVANNKNWTGHQNPPYEHADSWFAKNLDKAFGDGYTAFHKHHGVSIDHYDMSWFGLTLNLHNEEILNAIHDGDYDRIDYIFDEGIDAIQNPDCVKCLGLVPTTKHCRALGRPTHAHTTY